MSIKPYRRAGSTNVPDEVFESNAHDPGDLLTCSLWVLLDAIGWETAEVESWAADRARATWAFGAEHRHATIAELVTQVKRDGSSDTTGVVAADAVVRWVDATQISELPELDADVELTAWAENGRVHLRLAYPEEDRDLEPDRLVEVLSQILREVAADPTRAIDEVALVTPEERRWLIETLNDTAMPYPEERTIDGLVEQMARRDPGAIAVVDGDDVMTYGDLLVHARDVAERLKVAGVEPGEAVGVTFPRGIACVTAMLGVLLAGAVYVPVPINDPEPRREQLLRLAPVRVLLRSGDEPGAIALFLREGVAALFVRDHLPAPVDRMPLYVMFTSGSTGQPKAVVAHHQAAIRLIRDAGALRIRQDDVVGYASDPAFDATTWEVWGALCNGARLVVVDRDSLRSPEQLERLMRSQGMTVMFLTSSLFNVHARSSPTMFGALRALDIGGEAADPRCCRLVLQSAMPPGVLLNAYGPTEATTFATCYEIHDVPEGMVAMPIGTPLANTTLYVLDRHGRLVPPGMPGELFIGGDGLALGYLDAADLTTQRFVDDSFAGAPHRLYRTGDLVSRRDDGVVVYLGRFDEQVKIRGFRVEPREIEDAICSLPQVVAAAVISRFVGGSPRLVAYVVPGTGNVTAPAILRLLRAELPDYLVPSRVVLVDGLELTPNGKLDRSRLPDPFAAPDALEESSESRADDLGRALADIWCAVLGLSSVDDDEDFFDLGGDSLLAVELYGAVHRRFGVVVPAGLIDRGLTLATLSEAIRPALAREAPPIAVELTTTEGPPVLLVPSGGGELYNYRWLVRLLGPQFHVVGVREPGHYGTERRPRTFAELSRACADALGEAAIDRPVAVIGHSSGGLLAHQLGCDLASDGHGPELVALLDAPVPGASPPAHDLQLVNHPVRRRIRLISVHLRWGWARVRRVPASPYVAGIMAIRANRRRLRRAQPSSFPGRLLYVHAVEATDETVSPEAPGYWVERADSATVVEVRGDHTGPDSLLSRGRVADTAEAIADALTAAWDEQTDS